MKDITQMTEEEFLNLSLNEFMQQQLNGIHNDNGEEDIPIEKCSDEKLKKELIYLIEEWKIGGWGFVDIEREWLEQHEYISKGENYENF